MTRHPGLGRVIGALATSGIVGAGLAAAVAGPASAATLTCGMTITSSIKLHSNLNCRNYVGSGTTGVINIGAAGVTVNLNGHTITGPGINTSTIGIYDSGYSGLTVTGGKLNSFNTAVDVEGADSTSPLTGVVIEHLTISTGVPSYNTYSWGVYGEYLTGARIHNVTVNDAEYGVELDYSTAGVVSHNRAASPDYGFYDYYGSANIWLHNTVTGAFDYGLDANNAKGTTFSRNSVSGTAADGVGVDDSSGVTVTRNKFGSLYDDVYLDYNKGTSVTYNKSSHSSWGIYSYEETGSTFSHNTFSNGLFGIETDFPVTLNLVGNVTNSNADAGVYIYTNFKSGYSARLVHNMAKRNRYGFYSQAATTGHSNRAIHNTVLNCYNVACVRAALALGGHRAPEHLVPTAPQAPTPGIPAKR